MLVALFASGKGFVFFLFIGAKLYQRAGDQSLKGKDVNSKLVKPGGMRSNSTLVFYGVVFAATRGC